MRTPWPRLRLGWHRGAKIERRGLFVRFGVSKQNYDATPLDRWYQRHTGGVLLPVELQEASKSEEKERETRRRGDGF